MNKLTSEKQQLTVEKTKTVRYNDYINLRDIAEKRLQFCKVEKEKAEQGLKNLQSQLDKLLGAIIVLEELLKQK